MKKIDCKTNRATKTCLQNTKAKQQNRFKIFHFEGGAAEHSWGRSGFASGPLRPDPGSGGQWTDLWVILTQKNSDFRIYFSLPYNRPKTTSLLFILS